VSSLLSGERGSLPGSVPKAIGRDHNRDSGCEVKNSATDQPDCYDLNSGFEITKSLISAQRESIIGHVKTTPVSPCDA